MKTVGDVRHQTALAPANDPVFVVVNGAYYRCERVWPDTQMAPLGKGLYVQAEKDPILVREPKS